MLKFLVPPPSPSDLLPPRNAISLSQDLLELVFHQYPPPPRQSSHVPRPTDHEYLGTLFTAPFCTRYLSACSSLRSPCQPSSKAAGVPPPPQNLLPPSAPSGLSVPDISVPPGELTSMPAAVLKSSPGERRYGLSGTEAETADMFGIVFEGETMDRAGDCAPGPGWASCAAWL